ncbi:MAG: hypothetical protein HOM55_08815 [Proteobacteria bacterium]|nr:hypothetical protein [Pseudomonadota bacterium]
MIQDKAQSAENGESFLRTATPYWITWITPFGRVDKHSSVLLRLLAITGYYLRASPNGQTLIGSLNDQY